MIKNKNKGFSLIELVVTIAVMAALVVMLVPSFISAQNDARRDKDETKFESICTAFKTALGEPEVMKEVETFCDNQTLTITFDISENGTIVFGEGELAGNLDKKDLENTALWLNTYQSVGITYYVESKDFYGKSIVLDIVPKTSTTTAQCKYSIVD